MSRDNSCHVVLFPYMSKGHTIPLLHFARLLLRHRHVITSVTVFTTPQNEPFIRNSLSDNNADVISLPFPDIIAGIPPGVESTDKLPSMSLYVPFTRATKLLQPYFEHHLHNLPRVAFIVSDGFLWWTSESAAKFNIPRLAFYGMNCYSAALSISARVNRLFSRSEPGNNYNDTEPVIVPEFPWIRVKKSDFDPVFTDPNPSGPLFELLMDQIKSTSTSQGFIVNTFYELESTFVEYRQRMGGPKTWCVGPFCLAEPPPKPDRTGNKPVWIRWLDRKLEEGRPVLYVAFGTQAEISNPQLKEIALGLEESEVSFLWVTRRDVEEVEEGFEERVRERGMIAREWVNQREILWHESVKGFLSHCGWNSALETICAGVPVIAWPMMAEQPLNAKMLFEELKIGVRIETDDGTIKRLVNREELKKKVKMLMEGEVGKMARKKVKEYAEMAKKAMEEEKGSSWKDLDLLIHEMCGNQIKPV